MVILASKSETRAKILKDAGVNFKQIGIDIDEDILEKKYKNPKDYVCAVAKEKLKKAVEKLGLENPILVADTVVSVDGKILRKAKSKDEARELLKLQSGSKVSIFTCMAFKSKKKEFFDLSKTSYVFDEFNKKDLENYIKSGEWRGKAGACMVEGFCKKYIKKVNGLESTAKGLTVEKLLPILKEENV